MSYIAFGSKGETEIRSPLGEWVWNQERIPGGRVFKINLERWIRIWQAETLNQTQRTQLIMIWSWLPPATRKGCNSSISASQSLPIKDVGTCRQFSFSHCKFPEFHALSSGPPSQPHLHSLRSVLPVKEDQAHNGYTLRGGTPPPFLQTVPRHKEGPTEGFPARLADRALPHSI